MTYRDMFYLLSPFVLNSLQNSITLTCISDRGKKKIDLKKTVRVISLYMYL